MAGLKRHRDLHPGGVVVREEAVRPRTGGWRTGLKPRIDSSRCVNCLLCWVYCPDAAIVLDGDKLAGVDFEVCKGCEICAEMCPVEAIDMVAEAEQLPALGMVQGEDT